MLPLLLLLELCFFASSGSDEGAATHLSLAPRHAASTPHLLHSGPSIGMYGANVGPARRQKYTKKQDFFRRGRP